MTRGEGFGGNSYTIGCTLHYLIVLCSALFSLLLLHHISQKLVETCK